VSDAPDDVHVALLAPLRQDLRPAASAILDLGKVLGDAVAATDGDNEEFQADVARIVESTEILWRMVDGLIEAEAARTLFEGRSEAEAARTLRHDMRTPIAAIKGYSEMLLDDLEEFGVESLRPAFSDLLDEANALLVRIDKIVSF
jgi:adenylate cyclase